MADALRQEFRPFEPKSRAAVIVIERFRIHYCCDNDIEGQEHKEE